VPGTAHLLKGENWGHFVYAAYLDCKAAGI
jgi:hypothetical protein